VDFASLAWQEMAPGALHKVVERAGKRLRLLELTPDFVEKEWCEKAHAGFVFAGKVELAFEDRVERLGPGDGLILRAGERHKARAIGGPATLALVEDA